MASDCMCGRFFLAKVAISSVTWATFSLNLQICSLNGQIVLPNWHVFAQNLQLFSKSESGGSVRSGKLTQMNRVFATNYDFTIAISFQPDDANL